MSFFSRWSAVLPAESSYLGIIDPHSGQIVLRERLHRNILPPILSSDGSRVFLVNGGARSVRVLEIQTGEKTTIVENLPWPVAKVIGDPSDDSYLILAAIDGSVHKLHTPTGTITEIYVGGRLQSVVTVMGDGRLITSGFRSRELVVSESEYWPNPANHSASIENRLDTGRRYGSVHFRCDPGLAWR